MEYGDWTAFTWFDGLLDLHSIQDFEKQFYCYSSCHVIGYKRRGFQIIEYKEGEGSHGINKNIWALNSNFWVHSILFHALAFTSQSTMHTSKVKGKSTPSCKSNNTESHLNLSIQMKTRRPWVIITGLVSVVPPNISGIFRNGNNLKASTKVVQVGKVLTEMRNIFVDDLASVPITKFR